MNTDLQFVSLPGFDGDGWSQECRNVTISVLHVKLSADPMSAACSAIIKPSSLCCIVLYLFFPPEPSVSHLSLFLSWPCLCVLVFILHKLMISIPAHGESVRLSPHFVPPQRDPPLWHPFKTNDEQRKQKYIVQFPWFSQKSTFNICTWYRIFHHAEWINY